MNIGIDLDGVVFDSEKYFRVLTEIFEVDILKQNSIKNNNELKFQKRYNWDENTQRRFLDENYKNIIKNCNIMPGAKEVLNILKNQCNNNLIIITGRGLLIPNEVEMTFEKIKESDLDIFDKYIWKVKDKYTYCKEENIDFMIDDDPNICKDLSEKGINVLYFRENSSVSLKENEYLKVFNNWGEIYRFLQNNKRRSI